MRHLFLLSFLLAFFSCKQEKKQSISVPATVKKITISDAKGFSVEKLEGGITIVRITSPWPNSKTGFTYALVPKEKINTSLLDKSAYDAIVPVPVERIVATSTTHIPALEALGATDRLVGFTNTQYISSEATRKRIEKGEVQELGNNEAINTEMVLALQPDVVFGFGIDGQNKAYETLKRSGIPVVYNGDWTEGSPLGKAEWIKFFAPFFGKEEAADSIFAAIKSDYLKVKSLAKKAQNKPAVLSGALYKDVWYLPAGESWAAQFLEDANADYLWKNTKGTGSLSLSLENVLVKGQSADFWVSPSEYISYRGLKEGNPHYTQFDAFHNKKIYTFANTKGATGGLLYFELGPNRPDMILKDLVHIFHPELLPDYQPYFFKPLE
ncbi:ABC transporter substrate-binding protein [Flavobacteriaceae bacterium F89]|uniref:ABC transporter substrate-binding protein n=1 Tax=Cerina litoralis TaxID=2874477 RepID=A0AAE3ERP4_9FLAO|nr:ABC transporter substrate-binding protein [Cerina litoralis]MCG2459972.1 ABC transporter substrate-binding protein [Cerina litoralis]